MNRPAQPPRRVAPGRAIDWTEDDLDRLTEIHLEEDDPLMLAFVRQWGSPRLIAIVTAQREQDTDGDATNSGNDTDANA
jgi:hypothetical protein